MSDNTERAAYSVPDTAHRLNVSRSQVYRLLKSGDLKSIKIGARRLILPSSIRELLERSAVTRQP